jgi:hypothetical protein
MEPLADKEGCTTRLIDSSPGTKLEYFLVGGVGVGLVFGEIVDRFKDSPGRVPIFYDLGLKAQQESSRYRGGGKVSSGQIQVLLPLVAAHARWGDQDIPSVCSGAVELLGQTSRKDVEYLDKQLELAFAMSARRKNSGEIYDHAVLESASVLEACQKADHLWITQEIAAGYPRVQQMAANIGELGDGSILRASEDIYKMWLPEMGRPDAVADLIVACLYLHIFRNPESILFP